MKKFFKSVAAAVAVLGVSTAAFAIVTFDPATGAGFVGKGDVQLAFSWNNQALQKNAAGVSFEYQSLTKADVTCEWETVTGGPKSKTIFHEVTNRKTSNVTNSIAYDARVKNQITGFNLTGIAGGNETNDIPEVGDACPQGHSTAVVTEVVPMSVSGGLYVIYGDAKVLLQ